MYIRKAPFLVMLCMVAAPLHGLIFKKKHHHAKTTYTQQETLAPNLAPITIFVHGTLPPFISSILQHWDLPAGLNKTSALKNSLLCPLAQVGFLLNEGDPAAFPLEQTYLWGWSGALNFETRYQEAEKIYHLIKNYPGPITLIGHSHGGNIALQVARAAAAHNDQRPLIENLILLATPIQAATLHYINAPTFKNRFSFYSHYDIIQRIDPQWIYTASYQTNNEVPYFSDCIFPKHCNVIQARITAPQLMLVHIYFISRHFLRTLSTLINLLKDAATHNATHVFIRIPKHKKPYIIAAR